MKILISLVALLLVNGLRAQEVDLVRLGYDKAGLQAEQVGIAASGDGKFIAILFKDQTLRIFDVTLGKFVGKVTEPVQALDAHTDIRMTNDGKIIIINSDLVTVFPWRNPSQLKTFALSLGSGLVTTYFPSGNLLAVAGHRKGSLGSNSQVYVLDVATLTQLTKIDVRFKVMCMTVRHDGQTIALAGVNNESPLGPRGGLQVHELRTGRVVQEQPFKLLHVFTLVTYAEDDRTLYLGGSFQSQTFIWGLDENLKTTQKNFEHLSAFKGHMFNSGIHYQDKLAVLTMAGALDVYNCTDGKLVFTTKNDKASVKLTPNAVTTNYFFPLGGGKFIMNIFDNNINQIYDARTNSITGYLYVDANDDFAVVARDGRVDGTDAALTRVYWTSRRSTEKASLESRYEKGFTPRLMATLIADQSTGHVEFNADEAIAKIPTLTIKTFNNGPFRPGVPIVATQKGASIEVDVTQNAGEVSEVRLFQNGKLQKTKPNEGTSTYHFDAQLTSAFGEENFFYVSAQTKGGTESEKFKFTVRYKGATEERPRMFLLTIGINQYRNPKYNLNYAQADADALKNTLKPVAQGLFKEIIATDIRNEQATRDNILKALHTIQTQALEQDVLIVYYAGHGVMNGAAAEDRDFYIVPYDVIQLYGKDEVLKQKAISASELKKYAQSINAQKQVFILDACQSAGALEALAQRGAAEERAFAQLARSTGSFWITATGTDQFATEFEKLGHGVFTFALLEGISGKADANGDKKLTIKELSTYVENRVPELSEQYKGSAQFPSAYSFGNDFPISLYKP